MRQLGQCDLLGYCPDDATVLTGCPANVLVHCAADILAPATVTAVDACSNPLTVVPGETQTNPGGCTNVITRTWTVTDCAGNVSVARKSSPCTPMGRLP